MPEISFTEFTPRSFEQFAQALAAAVLGPGLLVFGDGPDGGREASYQGAVPYPNATAGWSGLTVMQAKFLQAPRHDARDAAWLVEQLKREAKLYAAGGRTVPDHYLLVSNVRLSGVDGVDRKGGQSKVRDAFETHLRPLGVSEFDVWHEAKIATLLDLHPQLHRSYEPWLAGREALGAVYRTFEARIPDFRATMLLYLQRELRAQRGTRLQQAGHVGDGATHLESLFVDLPYGVEPLLLDGHMRLLGDVGAANGEQGIVRTLLGAVSLKADPATLAQVGKDHAATPNRYLILGGPGQGKSTVTQFLGQVMRLRILRAEDPTRLSSDTLAALDAIATRLGELGLPLEGVRRYPLRVDLPLFADTLTASIAADARLSLLEYIARGMAKTADSPALDVLILRQWLGSYPFLVMLDGLDEVPPSGARRDVVAAIIEFWDEVAARGADVVLTVTTRPQGYNDDLDPELYTKLEMTHLTAEKALAYAERVAVLKLPDADRRALLLSRLTDAVGTPATAALMVSPLQVAILFQLVDQRGTAPTDRWTLFDEYLSVVVKREQEKHGAGGAIVRAHETLIRRLLRRVGLLLHVEAERGGAADAFLARSRLEAVAADLLGEEGYEGDELRGLAAGIVTAATDRLVFLEQRTEGRIEFDVRSLQEFMAAAELMTGGDAEVRARLREIAGRSHWQHVYRIAASKAFSAPDAIRFRDSVLLINRELDDDGPAARAVRQGAQRSLELADDGLGSGQPLFRRHLATHALELLGCTVAAVDGRLVELVRSLGEPYVRDALPWHLGAAIAAQRRAAWALLLSCVEARDDWADRLADQSWPTDPTMRLDALASGVLPPQGTLAADRVATSLEDVVPEDLRDRCYEVRGAPTGDVMSQLARRFTFLRPLLDRSSIKAFDVDVLPGGSVELTLSLVPTADEAHALLYAAPPGENWRPYGQVAEFVREPSMESAATFVEALGAPAAASLARIMQLPWPLLNLSTFVSSGRDAREVAAALRAGEFGDVDEWTDAEERLVDHGMSESDLDRWREGLLLDSSIADVGMPFPNRISLSRGGNTDALWLSALKDAALKAPPGPARELMVRILAFAMPAAAPQVVLSGQEYLALFGGHTAAGKLLDPALLATVDEGDLADASLLDFVADAGEAACIGLASERRSSGKISQQLLAGNGREGLLVAALAAVAASGTGVAGIANEIDEARLASDAGTVGGRDAVAALRLIKGIGKVHIPHLMGEPGDSVGQHALLAHAQGSIVLDSLVEKALAAFVGGVVGAEQVRAEALRILRGELDRRRSGLERPDRWRELGLPETLLARLGASR